MTREPHPSAVTKPVFPLRELCGRRTPEAVDAEKALRPQACVREWEVVREGFGGGDGQAEHE